MHHRSSLERDGLSCRKKSQLKWLTNAHRNSCSISVRGYTTVIVRLRNSHRLIATSQSAARIGPSFWIRVRVGLASLRRDGRIQVDGSWIKNSFLPFVVLVPSQPHAEDVRLDTLRNSYWEKKNVNRVAMWPTYYSATVSRVCDTLLKKTKMTELQWRRGDM